MPINSRTRVSGELRRWGHRPPRAMSRASVRMDQLRCRSHWDRSSPGSCFFSSLSTQNGQFRTYKHWRTRHGARRARSDPGSLTSYRLTQDMRHRANPMEDEDALSLCILTHAADSAAPFPVTSHGTQPRHPTHLQYIWIRECWTQPRHTVPHALRQGVDNVVLGSRDHQGTRKTGRPLQ